jgi:outer membrane protein assembly factor BamB
VNVKNGKEIVSINLDDNTLKDSIIKVTKNPLDSPWPMYCHDTRHTGRSQYSTANNPFEEKWWFKTTHEQDYCYHFCFCNIVDDGTIYFTNVEGYIYAFYPNGTLKWRSEIFGGHDTIECHPAIDENGTIYFGTYYGNFYAVNLNGTLKWKYDFPAGVLISSSPAIGEDGTIYFGTVNDGHIYAFYPNGTIKWKYKLISDSIGSSPAIANDGTIYIGDHDGYLYAIYPNGTLRWKVRLQYNYFGIPSGPSIADDGTIYVATYNNTEEDEGYLFAVDPNDGYVKWKYKIGSDFYVNPSLGEDGTIYVLVNINYATNPDTTKLYAINPDGTKKWIRDIGRYHIIYSDPAISADGTIYIAASDGVFAFNPDGSIRWCKELDIPLFCVESSPVIGKDGTIYLSLIHYREVAPTEYEEILCFHAFNELDTNAPSAPEITGPTKGKSGECYNYTIVSTDPNGDDVYYSVSWGEPSYKIPRKPWVPSMLEEYGPCPSGTEITINHTWTNRGSYSIKVITRDTNNLVSPWSILKVSMPKNKNQQSSQQFSNQLFFQIMQRLLNTR